MLETRNVIKTLILYFLDTNLRLKSVKVVKRFMSKCRDMEDNNWTRNLIFVNTSMMAHIGTRNQWIITCEVRGKYEYILIDIDLHCACRGK